MQIVARVKRIALGLTIQTTGEIVTNIDALRFHEVVENLVNNAIEYTRDGGTVDVNLKKIKDIISVSVKDTGIGISEGDKEKLFTKFFRSEEAVKSHPEGTGLGLYVVKSYVERWGGKIDVESVYGKGSTFTITLPIRSINSEQRKEV
jgi:signal transduction histidine kinase